MLASKRLSDIKKMLIRALHVVQHIYTWVNKMLCFFHFWKLKKIPIVNRIWQYFPQCLSSTSFSQSKFARPTMALASAFAMLVWTFSLAHSSPHVDVAPIALFLCSSSLLLHPVSWPTKSSSHRHGLLLNDNNKPHWEAVRSCGN